MKKTKTVEFTKDEYGLIKSLFLTVTKDPQFENFEMFQRLDFLHLMEKFVGPFDEPTPTSAYVPPVAPRPK